MDLVVRLAILSLRPVESYWSSRIDRRLGRSERHAGEPTAPRRSTPSLGLGGPLESARAERERAENIAGALRTSRQIGIAIGIVMKQEDVDPEEAFARLSAASQDANQRLATLAEDVIRERCLRTPGRVRPAGP